MKLFGFSNKTAVPPGWEPCLSLYPSLPFLFLFLLSLPFLFCTHTSHPHPHSHPHILHVSGHPRGSYSSFQWLGHWATIFGQEHCGSLLSNLRIRFCSAFSKQEPSAAPHSLVQQAQQLGLTPQTIHSLVSPAASATSSGCVGSSVKLDGSGPQGYSVALSFCVCTCSSSAWETLFPFPMAILPAILQEVLPDPLLFAMTPPNQKVQLSLSPPSCPLPSSPTQRSAQLQICAQCLPRDTSALPEPEAKGQAGVRGSFTRVPGHSQG